MKNGRCKIHGGIDWTKTKAWTILKGRQGKEASS
ncbi:MAG: hypothetical protein RLZZ189_208 [Pseudomonadota bacterium]|jgi:hypothetical protein